LWKGFRALVIILEWIMGCSCIVVGIFEKGYLNMGIGYYIKTIQPIVASISEQETQILGGGDRLKYLQFLPPPPPPQCRKLNVSIFL
jgi:hypothetical protein